MRPLGSSRRFLLNKVAAGLGIFFLFFLTYEFSLARSAEQSPQSDAKDSTSSERNADKPAAEVASREEATTFKVNVRLVLTRVVVRDSQGHAVGSLRKEDFQVFDNRKPQLITHFALEQPGTQIAREQKTQVDSGETRTADLAERFIAYVFDDFHLGIEDLMPVRVALERRLNSLQSTDRAGIFTTSGQGNLDFTDDRGRLREAVLRIQPRSLSAQGVQQCPYMSYYMADLIVNQQDPVALDNATRDALECSGMAASRGDASAALARAQALAESRAMEEVTLGESEVEFVVRAIKDVVRRMSIAPGQRVVVLVSPGFITPRLEAEVSELIDDALRTNTTISTLDARGLYIPAAIGDLGRANVPNLRTSPQEALYENAAASANDTVLAMLAQSTGGTFFHNNNDFESELKQAAETPEYYYVLGFSPQNLKYDGRFHSLKVTLNRATKFTIGARTGYYAPRQPPNAEEQAKQEIQEALFSQEEVHDLPVDLHTQFFKPSDVDAKLSLLVHVDVKRLRFRKSEGRNNNNLTIAAALFDRNGRFVTSNEKILEMRLKDETLERKLGSGVTLKTSFAVKPGSYLVRLVVRDTEGLLSAENGAVEIP